MSTRLAATDHESLERLVGYVHDAWFDVERISREDDVVSIPIVLRGQLVKKRFLPRFEKSPDSYESQLTIRGVRDMDVNEPAGIAVYCMNYLKFDPPCLTIVAEPDCTLTVEVDALDVEAALRMRPYAWEAPGATALVVLLPEAEPAIGELRRTHTPSGREGMPAHATLIAPFLHASRLAPEDAVVVRDALGPFAPFEVTLASFGRFEQIGCLYLEPDPPDPFVAMSEALLAVYPEVEYPPEGATQIVPHVTIGGHLTAEQQEQIKVEVAPHLPVHARAERVVLVERGEDGRWFDREVFYLAP